VDNPVVLQLLTTLSELGALATVVETKGSTPRKVGAKMIVTEKGVAAGTIGGGCGEGEVIEVALQVMKDGNPRMVRIDLTEDLLSLSPAVCGGIMNIFVEPLNRTSAETKDPTGGS